MGSERVSDAESMFGITSGSISAGETVQTVGYEWRWAATANDAEKYVAVKTADETRPPLILCRTEKWEKGLNGGIRAVPVMPQEIEQLKPVNEATTDDNR